MPPRVFLKPALMLWDNNAISDHNRSPVAIDVERIETSNRMANGTLRKYVIADKRTFDVSWDDLPHAAEYTVDGFWGKNEIEAFYNGDLIDPQGTARWPGPNPFTLTLNEGDGTVKTYTVMFSSFSAEISRRGLYDFWNVSVSLEEV